MQDVQKSCNGPTVTAHIVLAVSSCWSCKDLGFIKLGFGIVGLVLYIATGLLGIVLYSVSRSGQMSYKVYSNLWLWSLSLALPSISCQLYLANKLSNVVVVALLHFVPPCLLIVCNVLYKRPLFVALELMQGVYLAAIVYVSLVNTSHYGLALVTSYAISYYMIGHTGTVQNAPAKDLLSYSLAFANYFTVKTLQGY